MKSVKLTRAELLRRGWTEKMMKDFLPSPERKQNPHRRGAPPLKLWDLADVNAAMAKPEWKAAKAAADRRRQNTVARQEGRTERRLKEIEVLISRIEVRRIGDVEDLALREQENSAFWRGDFFFEYDGDRDLLERWVVNYILRHLTDFDPVVYERASSLEGDFIDLKYRKAVIDKIAEVYPEYADECARRAEML